MKFREIDSFERALHVLLEDVLEFKKDDPMKLDEVKRVLCIEPHPDDCVIGMGGTIKRLTEQGIEVEYLCMTDGSMGTTEETENLTPHELATMRMKEEEESAKMLGVRKILWLGYKDMHLPYSIEARNRVIEVVREEKPDVVTIPDPWLPYESHPDHRNTGFLALDAVAAASLKNVLNPGPAPHSVSAIAFYYTHKPNYFVDITDLMELKLKAIRTHRSQFPDSIWEEWEPFLRTVALYYGRKAGVKYAEGLRVIPALFLHITPFAGEL